MMDPFLPFIIFCGHINHPKEIHFEFCLAAGRITEPWIRMDGILPHE